MRSSPGEEQRAVLSNRMTMRTRGLRVLSPLLWVSAFACGSASVDAPSATDDAALDDAQTSDVSAPDAEDTASSDDAEVPASGPCDPYGRPFYGPAPYQGIHGGPGHTDLVACDLAPSFTAGWHALTGFGVAQPNTFSPDGRTTYVTTSAPPADESGCTLHALDTVTGSTRWCKPVPGAIGASADVDVDGHLYVAAAGAVRSFTAEGEERWTLPLAPNEAAFGSHFTSDGYVATVTSAARLLLLERADGRIAAELDLAEAFGLAPGPSAIDVELATLLPDPVKDDFERVFGDVGDLLSQFGGVSQGYTDNTVAIGPDGSLYAVGWGAPDEDGDRSVVKIRVAEGPVLEPMWRVRLVKGSASSPSVSPDGRWLKITDGNSNLSTLAPKDAGGSMRLVDIAACDENTDANTDPGRCEPASVVPLRSGPALGASPILDAGEHYQWEVQLAGLTTPSSVPDLIRYDGEKPVWELHLPGNASWTSVLTLTRDHVIGTVTWASPSDESLGGIVLPATAESALIVVRRDTGRVESYARVPDDSTSTVTVGPDGALYVTLLGLISGFALDTPIVGGVVRFDPSDASPEPFDWVRPPTPLPPIGEALDYTDGPGVAMPFPGGPPPAHPHLAPIPDSNIHNDAWMTDAYDRPGPIGNGAVRRSADLGGLCGTIAFDTQGRIMTTCLGISDPTLYLLDPRTLGEIARFPLPPRAAPTSGRNPLQDYTGGGYFALDADDHAILATSERTILRVGAGMRDGLTVLEEKERIDLTSTLGEDERVTSVLPDWDGRLWIVTRGGRVLVEAGGAVAARDLGEAVQNSFAIDDEGAYLVTDAALYKLGCDGDCTKGPAVRWRQVYANSGIDKPGQADAGSGTTPTLFDHALGPMVAITDNADPMQVVVLRRDDGSIVCEVPVFAMGASATENSLIASGESLFVENNYGYEGLSDVTGKTTTPGFARVDVEADGSCSVVWSTDAVSAPSVVPKLSRATGLIYSFAKAGDSDGWYWTAIDAHTGEVAFRRLAGTGPAFNNNYAGLALGKEGRAFLGVLLGVVSLEDTAP